MVYKSLKNKKNAKVIKPYQYDMWKNRIKTKWQTSIRR